MAKGSWSKYRNNRLDFYVKPEVRRKVIGLSFLFGFKGKHAQICRRIIDMGLDVMLKSLTEKQQKDLKEIMVNVNMVEDPKLLVLD